MDFRQMRQKTRGQAEARGQGAGLPPRPGPASGSLRGEDDGNPPARVAERAPEDVERIEDVLRAELGAPLAGPGDLARAAAMSPPVPATPVDPLDEFFWREDEISPSLLDLAGAAPMRAAPDVAEARREWLTFLLAGEEYAVAIEQVREILKAPAITEVPRAPAHVLGVIMVRGEVIAILDPRRRLGLPMAVPGRQARVLVCDAGEGLRGLLVDAVSNVVRLPPSSVEARPSGVGGPSAEYIAGIGRERDRLFILLDLKAVLRDAAPARPTEAA